MDASLGRFGSEGGPYTDDTIIVTWVLCSGVRRAGLQPPRRHWPGSPDGLAAVARLCGLTDHDAASNTA
jgi:hypothetical protein